MHHAVSREQMTLAYSLYMVPRAGSARPILFAGILFARFQSAGTGNINKQVVSTHAPSWSMQNVQTLCPALHRLPSAITG